MALEALLTTQIIGLQPLLDAKLGGSTGSTDNRVLRSDGVGGVTVQASPVTIDDSGNISGLGTITTSGVVSVPVNGTAADPALRVGTQVSGLACTTNQLQFVVDGAVRAWADRNSLLNANAFNVRTTSGYYTINDDVYIYRNATGPSAEIRAAGGLLVKNAAGSADAALSCGAITASGKIQSGSNVHLVSDAGFASLSPTTSRNFLLGGGKVQLWNEGSYRAELNWATSGTVKITDGGSGFRAWQCGAITASGLVNVGTYTFGTLPAAASNAGALAQITDSSVTTNGTIAAGGGSDRAIVFSDGTDWIVAVA